MRVHRVPNRFAGLLVLGEHVPIGADPLVGAPASPSQGHVILAPTAMGDNDCPLLAALKRLPSLALVRTCSPAIGRQVYDAHQSSKMIVTLPFCGPSASTGRKTR